MAKYSGLCVSKGNVQGVVKLVKANDYCLSNIKPNTILVMKVLDRDVLLSMDKHVVGVIAEHGNIGSHGAGILRQLKIPCILRIHDATNIFKDDSQISICGDDNTVIYNEVVSHLNYEIEHLDSTFSACYAAVSKHPFTINDIKIQNNWTSLRPTRQYQKLRFDMLHDAHVNGPNLLFGLPFTEVKQDNNGIMIEYGAPNVLDICSFYLDNPDWLLEKCTERSDDVAYIKAELQKLMALVEKCDFNSIVQVFWKCTELYRILFKYMYMSQATSEIMLDIYLDFLENILHVKTSRGLLGLNSDYLKRSLVSGVYPGISQIWSSKKSTPNIWDGKIDYSPLPIDKNVSDAISLSGQDKDKYFSDYESFRIIVPLLYQLSEEYYFVSSSIHSFASWSLIKISEYAAELYPSITVEDLYEKSLYEFKQLLLEINKKIG